MIRRDGNASYKLSAAILAVSSTSIDLQDYMMMTGFDLASSK